MSGPKRQTDPTVILLAAGRGTRMRGGDKMLEDVDGAPAIAVMAARAVKCGPTRVVIAQGQDARRAALDGAAVDIVQVPAGGGMGGSIAAGARGLTGPALILPGDMPGLRASDLYLLIGLHRHAPTAILRGADAGGTPGHPVLFPARLTPDLSRLTGDTGARDLLKRHAGLVHLVPLDGDRACRDLDTPEDWAKWRAGTAN